MSRAKGIRKRAFEIFDDDTRISVTLSNQFVPLRAQRTSAPDDSPNHKYELVTNLDGSNNYPKELLESLITKPYYQDNTSNFEVLLEPCAVTIIIFPPGSGKTILGELFLNYVSKEEKYNKKIASHLEKCAFSTATKYKAHLRKHDALRISFANFERCKNADHFVDQIIDLAQHTFSKEFDKFDVQTEQYAVNYFRKFVSRMIRDPNQRAFVIVDSVDSAYNSILHLSSEEFDRCKTILKKVTNICDFNYVNVIFLGVSPYLGTLFKIDDQRTLSMETAPSFNTSLTKATIKTAISKMKLKILPDEVEAYSQMRYKNTFFTNPMLAIQYLRAVQDKLPFLCDMLPRSVWFDAIFTKTDILLLEWALNNESLEVGSVWWTYEQLRQACEHCEQPNVGLLRYIFLWGGYFSLELIEPKQSYKLTTSNLTTRILLSKILDFVVNVKNKKLPCRRPSHRRPWEAS